MNMMSAAAHTIDRFRKPRVWALTAQLEKRQWWSYERLTEFSRSAASKVVKHALRTVPYYRRVAETTGIAPESFDFNRDFERIPKATRTLLLESSDDLRSEAAPPGARENWSSGSTGRKVRFLVDPRMYDLCDAYLNLFYKWAGWREGEMVMHLWGGGAAQPSARGMQAMKRRLSGRLVAPVYLLSDEVFDGWWNDLCRYRPSVLYVYPSVAARFAEWLKSTGRKPTGIRGVICSAEVLTVPHRRLLKEVFDCRVLNQYGCREAPAIACECPEGNMHVFVDANVVEFDVPGVEDAGGAVFVTALYNYAQPFLRYDIGDTASPKEERCSCGRGYPLMGMGIGRKNDTLIGLDGRMVNPNFFVHLIDEREWVVNYQFRQTSPETVIIYVEADPRHSRAEELKRVVVPEVRTAMGGGECEVRLVDRIERTAAGKVRRVVSDLER